MGDGGWHSLSSSTASSLSSVAAGVTRLSLRVTSENGLENRIYTVDLTIPASGQGKPAIVVDPSPSTYAERFGHAVAMSDDGLTMAVGDVGGSYVHVFYRTSVDAVWAHSATLYPKDNSSTYYGTFGYALAISGDGKVVAAANSGGWVDLFSKGGDGTWTYTKTLTGSGSQYGCSVALSHDGSTIVVGDYYLFNSDNNLYPGAVYCYRASDWDNPVEIASPVANKEYWFGWTVAVSADGNTIVIGAPHCVATADMAGAFYVYRYSDLTGKWTKAAEQFCPRAIASAEFGYSVAVSDDCGFILVGSQGMMPGIAGSSDRTGAAYLYSWDGNALSACGSVVVPLGATDQARVGWSVALSANGLHAVIGAPQFRVSGITYSGAAFLYDVGTGGLSLSNSFLNPHPMSGDEFGYSVDIGSGNSPAFAIGAEKVEPAGVADQGVVYVY